MNSLNEQIREVEEKDAGERLDRSLAAHNERARSQALILLGGIKVSYKIADSLNSQAMRALIQFQEEKGHEALGYDRFVDFLEESEYSPMSKHQFYDRKMLLEREGDVVFELLNTVGMSIRHRKLLGTGAVMVEGSEVLVKIDETEFRFGMDDHAQIRDVLVAIADSNTEKTRKLEKNEEEIQKAAENAEKLETELAKVKAAKLVEGGTDPHTLAIGNLGAAFNSLITEVEKLILVERLQFRDRTFEIIAMYMQRLGDAHMVTDWAEQIPRRSASSNGEIVNVNMEPADPDKELFEQLLDQAADTEEDNDAKLAASM